MCKLGNLLPTQGRPVARRAVVSIAPPSKRLRPAHSRRPPPGGGGGPDPRHPLRVDNPRSATEASDGHAEKTFSNDEAATLRKKPCCGTRCNANTVSFGRHCKPIQRYHSMIYCTPKKIFREDLPAWF